MRAGHGTSPNERSARIGRGALESRVPSVWALAPGSTERRTLLLARTGLRQTEYRRFWPENTAGLMNPYLHAFRPAMAGLCASERQ